MVLRPVHRTPDLFAITLCYITDEDAVTAVEPRLEPGATGSGQPVWRRAVGDYVALTKPRIIELLLVTTFPTMFLAQRGLPPLWLILATLVGGTLSAASANVLNCYLDRDIDKVMHRTENRPLVTGAIAPGAALRFGAVLGLASTLWLGLLVNWLSAALSLAAIALYVGFYTMLLKRRTPQNIVWGGAAGCMPVLIGWSAVTGSLSWAPVVLFGVIFFWTPPHYWPLSLRFVEDYAAAGVPMLPVVRGDVEATRQIVRYSLAMVAVTLLPAVVGISGWAYVGAAVFLGAWFLYLARRLRRDPGPARAGALFHYSLLYLALLFVAMALDAALTTPIT